MIEQLASVSAGAVEPLELFDYHKEMPMRIAVYVVLWLMLLVPTQIVLDAMGLGTPLPIELTQARSVPLYIAAKLGAAIGTPWNWLITAILAQQLGKRLMKSMDRPKGESQS